MTLATAKALTTPEEFMTLPDARDYELVEGNLVERKSMGFHSCYVAAQLITSLTIYCREQKSGWIFGSEATYRCFPSSNTLKRPDVSFIRRGRLPGEQLPQGYCSIAPDLAIEVVSPNDLADDVEQKALDYLSAGVPLVWVVYPLTRSIHVYNADGTLTLFTEDEQLTGAPVLPGFTCAVGDLFPPR